MRVVAIQMKIAGFLLLLAGWVLVLGGAWRCFPQLVPSVAFLLAGLGVEVLGLRCWPARSHLTPEKEDEG